MTGLIQLPKPVYVTVNGPSTNATTQVPGSQVADKCFGLSVTADNTAVGTYSGGTEFASGYDGTGINIKAAWRKLTGSESFDINANQERLRTFTFHNVNNFRNPSYTNVASGTAISVAARTWTDPRTILFCYVAVVTGGGVHTPPAAMTQIFTQGSANFDHWAGYFQGAGWAAQNYAHTVARESCMFTVELIP